MAAGLYITERAIRFLYPQYDPSGQIRFIYDEQYNMRIGKKNFVGRQRKNTGDYDVIVRFNKYGFRDVKDISKIETKVFLVVGDSFSFGWCVNQSYRYSDQLETLLNKPVYNISISNNLLGYQGLIKYTESLNADVENVILGFSMENDLLNYDKHHHSQKLESNNIFNYQNIKKYLSQYALFNLFTTFVHSNQYLKDLFVKSGFIIGNIEGISKNYLDTVALKSTHSIIEEIHNKYNLIILIIPSRGLWIGNNIEIENKVHNEFVSTLNNNQINTIDLRKAFEINSNPLSYHFKNDGHWNEKGHILAAKQLYEYISQNCKKFGDIYCEKTH